MTPYYRPDGGGLERYAEGVLSRLAGRGHQVDVVCFAADPGTILQDGVKVHRTRPSFRLGSTPIRRDFSERVEAMLEATGADVLAAHTPVPFPAEMAYRAARRRGVPFVLTYHSGRLRGSSPALHVLAALDRWTLERRMVRGADALVAVSPYVRDHALATRRDQVTVIPPGVDLHAFRPGGAPDPASILFVGPLSSRYRWKGIDRLWDAFQRVRESHPKARLRLVGRGDRFDEFWGRARDLGEGVRIDRHLSDTQLADAYRRSTAVVLPSTTDAEAFGMVLAEANACGRPVVGTRVGGIQDFIREGENGFLVPPHDPDALARRISQLLDEPWLADAMGAAGRVLVEREHDWRGLTDRTEAVLARAAGKEAELGRPTPSRRPRRSLKRGAPKLVQAPKRLRVKARRAKVARQGVRA